MDEFPDADNAEEIDEAYWNYFSQGREGNFLFTWMWVPTVTDGVLTLNVIDVDVTELIAHEGPNQVIAGWDSIVMHTAADYEWTVGDSFWVTAVDTGYVRVSGNNTDWSAYSQVFLGMNLESETGESFYINTSFGLTFDCNEDGGYACSGSDWYSHEVVEPGDQLVVTHYEPEYDWQVVRFEVRK